MRLVDLSFRYARRSPWILHELGLTLPSGSVIATADGIKGLLDDPSLNSYLIMDNGSSHTSRATRARLTAHPRFKVTYTPKHASRLNMIEMWFSVLTRRLLHRGDFTSRTDLMTQIDDFTIGHNATARPYQWRYDARHEHARYLTRHDQQRALLTAA